MTVITLNIGGIPQQNLIFISPHLAKWIGWFSSSNFAGWEAHASLKQSIEVLLSIALKETYCEKLELIHASHWVDILSRYDLFGWLVTEKIVFCLPVCGKGVGIWLKKKSLPLFTLSLPFPFFLYPAAQGMWPKYSGFGILDCTAWSTGAHMSSSNYSTMCLVSMCKQDATVELLVLLTHFLFSR